MTISPDHPPRPARPRHQGGHDHPEGRARRRRRHHCHLRRPGPLHLLPGQVRRGHGTAAHDHGRAPARRRARPRGLSPRPASAPVTEADHRADRASARRARPSRSSGGERPAGAPARRSRSTRASASARSRWRCRRTSITRPPTSRSCSPRPAARSRTCRPRCSRPCPRRCATRAGEVTVTTFGRRILAVEAGDTALHKFGLAIDIGTTSVVTTLHGARVGRAARGGVEPEPAGGLRRRPDVAHRLRPVRPGQPPQAADAHHRPAQPARRADRARVGRAGQVDLQGGDRGQHLHAPPAPRHRSLLRGPRPLRAGDAPPARRCPPASSSSRCPPRRACACSRSWPASWAPTRWRWRSPPASTSPPTLRIAVDIGTNGEVLLGSRERLWACSAPAGPALARG